MANGVFQCLTTTFTENAIYVQDQWCSCLTGQVTYTEMEVVLESLNAHFALDAS